METVSKDVLFTIAMNLELPELLKWCSSNSRIQKDVCNNDNNVWRSKLLKDFPDYSKFNLKRSLRETYVFMYQLSYIKKLLNTEESLYDIFKKISIDLSWKGLTKVPAFDLPNLEVLHLDNNNLTEVPLFRLPNLEILNLNNNQLAKISIPDLPNLEILYLNNNKLIELPLPNLPKLRGLYLKGNNFTEEEKKRIKEKSQFKLIEKLMEK
jgi:Leucine-rich repeat (LRR) protein